MTPHEALATLRHSPEDFLSKYYISIAGSIANSGQIPYFIKTLGGGLRTERPGRRSTRAFDIDTFGPGGDGLTFDAQSIKMLESQNVVLEGLVGYLVPHNAGPDVMVTGQITNCTFCCQWTPAGVLMTHIQPTGGMMGDTLCAAIRLRGKFVGESPAGFMFYGQGSEYTADENLSVVGVRRNGEWSVYAQVHTRPHITTAKQIRRVDTIYGA